MGITAAQVNELRQQTGSGLMDCKKALTEANGDIEAAIDILRKKGQKVSALRAGKAASEGAVVAQVNDAGNFGVVVKLSSETDFVAKNEEFQALINKIADLAMAEKPADLEALKTLPLGGLTVGEAVTELVGKINENIQLTEYDSLSGDTVVAYNHAGNRIGVLTALNKAANDELLALAKDVSMQIAAMSPVAVDESGVDQSIIDREMKLGKEKALAEGKPENIVEKIAEGTVKKFLKENTLLAQQFVKDSSKNVDQVLKGFDKELTVIDFKRVALG